MNTNSGIILTATIHMWLLELISGLNSRAGEKKWRLSIRAVNEKWMRNMEKSGIPVKPMMRWNVNGTVVTPSVACGLKITLATDSCETPMLFTTETISLRLWIIHFLILAMHPLRKKSVMNGFLKGFVQCLMEKSCRLLCVVSTYQQTGHLNHWRITVFFSHLSVG